MKLLLFLLLTASLLQAKHLHKEKYYQKIFCSKINGLIEYELTNKTRIDCLTNTYAIEVDFANKFYEAIGQSLYYGLVTNHSPGIVLILENPKKDIKYLKRLMKVAKVHKITVWTLDKNRTIKRIKL